MQLVKDQPEEMKARGQRGRIWAEKTFNPYDILARIEKFIDDLPEDHGYDFSFRTEFPFLEAPFSTKLEEPEWITDTYKTFFGVDLNDQDKNYIAMRDEVARGATRNDVYLKCREIAENELKKRGQIKVDPEVYFLKNGKKRLLYDLGGDFGDCLISLAVLEQLRELYPPEEWDIYVSVYKRYEELFKHLDFIAGFIPFLDVKHFELWEGARGQKKIVDAWIAPQLDRSYIRNGVDKNMFHPKLSLTNSENPLI
jgi:hypothetical protein